MQPWSGIPNFALIAAMLTLAAVQPNARAQDVYPTRPVRIISPFAPGGGNDTVARLLAAKFPEQMGGTYVVENRAGSGGLIGADLACAGTPFIVAASVPETKPSVLSSISAMRGAFCASTRRE